MQEDDKSKSVTEPSNEPAIHEKRRVTILDEHELRDDRDHLDYDAAFALTGYGRMNYLTLVACSLIFVYCSQEMTGIAYIIPPAECELNLTVGQNSLVNSGIFIGIVSSSICWGSVSDRYGRRKVMLPALIGSMLLSFMSSYSNGFWSMFLLRLLTGVFVSASTSTALVYLSELHAKDHRDWAIAVAVTSDQVNFVLFPGVAWCIIPRQWSFYIGSFLVKPWRTFMWTWSVTGIIGTAILFKLPESPRFILATKGSNEALPILAQIYACNMKKSSSEYPVHFIRNDIQSVQSLEKGAACRKLCRSLRRLVTPPLRRCFLITHFCMFMVNMLSNGLYIWMPAIINESIKNVNMKGSICSLINIKYMDDSDELAHAAMWSPHVPHVDMTFTYETPSCEGMEVNAMTYPLSMIMELFYLIPFLIVVCIIEKFSITRIYTVLMSMCAVSLSGCCVIPQILVATLLLTLGLCSGSGASLLSALAVEAFPTKLRALALCTMFSVGQFGTIVGICLISQMNGIVCPILFFMVSALVTISVVILNVLWPDLKEVRETMERQAFTY